MGLHIVRNLISSVKSVFMEDSFTVVVGDHASIAYKNYDNACTSTLSLHCPSLTQLYRMSHEETEIISLYVLLIKYKEYSLHNRKP